MVLQSCYFRVPPELGGPGPAHHCASSHPRISYRHKRSFATHHGSSLSTNDFAARSPYKYLLDDPDFRRFIQNIRRRSEDSASETIRRFGMIDKRFHKLPKYFTRMSTKRAKHFLLDMIEDFESKGGEDGGDLAGSYIQNFVKSINRWLEYNDITPAKKINVEGAGDSVRYENERPPTPVSILGRQTFAIVAHKKHHVFRFVRRTPFRIFLRVQQIAGFVFVSKASLPLGAKHPSVWLRFS